VLTTGTGICVPKLRVVRPPPFTTVAQRCPSPPGSHIPFSVQSCPLAAFDHICNSRTHIAASRLASSVLYPEAYHRLSAPFFSLVIPRDLIQGRHRCDAWTPSPPPTLVEIGVYCSSLFTNILKFENARCTLYSPPRSPCSLREGLCLVISRDGSIKGFTRKWRLGFCARCVTCSCSSSPSACAGSNLIDKS